MDHGKSVCSHGSGALSSDCFTTGLGRAGSGQLTSVSSADSSGSGLISSADSSGSGLRGACAGDEAAEAAFVNKAGNMVLRGVSLILRAASCLQCWAIRRWELEL